MTTKSRLLLLSSLAATPVFGAPFLAIGDNAELFLTARAETRFEDNITFTMDDDKRDDVVFEAKPGAELVFGKNSLTSGSFSVAERLIAYSDNTDYNVQLMELAFSSSYEGAKLRVLTRASFTERNQNEKDSTGLIRRDSTNAGVTGELAVSEKSKLGAGFSYDKTDYKKENFEDRETYVVPLNYYFAIRPKVDLSFGVQYRATEVDETGATSLDSEQLFYNVGARGEFTPKLSGSFRVGYATREGDEGGDSDIIGLDAGFVYQYSLKTQFTLDLGNDFDTSSAGRGQEVQSVAVGVRSSFAPGFTASASIGYDMTDYVGSDREDDYFRGFAGISYTVNQHLSLEANYNYLDNSSDGSAGSEFTANILTLAANFRY
jgi:hypothetical protein